MILFADEEKPISIKLENDTVVIGGLPITVTDRTSAARRIRDAALMHRNAGGRPCYQTSANGQVLALCERDAATRSLFLAADAIHADGMPMVFASRLLGRTALPERVATTDLIQEVMALSAEVGLKSFLLGASAEVNAAAVANLRNLYPAVAVIGHHGYYDPAEESRIVDLINAEAPDVLWVGLGVPKEQAFVVRNLDRLNVGVIKTSGGLFDFVSGRRLRAPRILQSMGLEWLWRALLEPRRLGPRYLATNTDAMRLLLTQTR